jgi:hypothetical protein
MKQSAVKITPGLLPSGRVGREKYGQTGDRTRGVLPLYNPVGNVEESSTPTGRWLKVNAVFWLRAWPYGISRDFQRLCTDNAIAELRKYRRLRCTRKEPRWAHTIPQKCMLWRPRAIQSCDSSGFPE